MKNQPLLYAGAGLLVGAALATAVATLAVNSQNTSLMRTMGMKTTNSSESSDATGHASHMSMSMADMSESLKGKTGDDFDKLFISEMIDHHQGAIDMAMLAQQNAKHAEIKQLSDDIIKAQTAEIDQMRRWQADWGYQPKP